MDYLDECERIDAAVFSSDFLWSEQQRKMLREYAERWLRAIEERETLLVLEELGGADS